MAYTETKTTGWTERMGNSFKGIVTGIVLILAATFLLYWNEGRTVKTGGAIGEARMATVKVDDISKLDPSLSGKVIYANGRADTKDTVKDPLFGAYATAINVARKVEYYQWTEQSKQEKKKKLGGGEETVTTYTYMKKWVPEPIDSGNFADPDHRPDIEAQLLAQALGPTHRLSDKGPNVTLGKFKDEKFYAPLVTFGAYKFPDFLKYGVGGDTPLELKLTSGDVANIANQITIPKLYTHFYGEGAISADKCVHVQGNTVYLGVSPGLPRVGDVRVTFTQVPPADVSIIAQVIGDTFEQFTASNGYTFYRLEMGKVGTEKMFAGAESENKVMAWILRVVGTVLVISGIGMVLRPLSVIADVLPILGSIIGAGTSFVAFLLGLAWSLLIIAIAWIRFRPILAGGLLAGAVVLIGLLFMKGRRNKAASV